MRRTIALAFVMALILGVVPMAGAQSAAGPNATTWVETDTMGAWVILAPPRDNCVNDSWIQSHMTFFRGGTGDTMPADPFDNAGEFTAVEDGTVTHTGDIWWVVSGRTELQPMNPDEPCNPEFGFPVKGAFHGKGAMRINESTGEGPSRVGVTCTFNVVTHLTGTTGPPPVLQWAGNMVAHCDDGAKLHLNLLGPTGGYLEPGGIEQDGFGVIHDK